MFWAIVGGVLAVLLFGCWLYDRRRKAPLGGIKGPRDDDTVGQAKAASRNRNISGFGRM